MEFLRYLDIKIGRWLSYADTCLNADIDLARCQGFWTFVAVVLGIVCALVLIAGAAKYLADRRKGTRQHGEARYRKPS